MKLKYFVVFISALYLFSDCYAAQLGENLVVNGDFESELQNWDVDTALTWKSGNGSNETGALFMNASYKAKGRIIYQASAETCINIENAQLFLFSANFRYAELPLEAHGHRANLVWYNEENCHGGGQYGGYMEPDLNTDWQYLTKNNIKPSLNAKSVALRLVQHQKSSAISPSAWDQFKTSAYGLFGKSYSPELASSYWDNVALIPLALAAENLSVEGSQDPISTRVFDRPIGVNYLKNPTFSLGQAGWNIGVDYLISQDEGYGEQGALRTTISSDSGSRGRGAFSQCINFGTARIFEAGILFKRDESSSQNGGGRFRPTWYENLDCKGRAETSTNHADPSTADGWQKLVVMDLIPAQGSRSVVLSAIQSIDGPGEFSVFWDEAYFKAISD